MTVLIICLSVLGALILGVLITGLLVLRELDRR
jgi:hypothetical protein